MFYQYRRTFQYWWLDRSLRGVTTTPPVGTLPGGAYIAVSQVCKRDVYMYLLATKSFFRYFPPAAIYALDDGSLHDADRALIKAHLPDVRFVAIAEVDTGPCPKGACWERLALVARLATEGYVIQLDCDTLTLAPPARLIELVNTGSGFTQGTFQGREILSMKQFCATLPAEVPDDAHVQLVAEGHFNQLRRFDALKYVRGCAGFAGFARGSVDRAAMVAFSSELETLVGRTKWSEWGSEQVTSNLLVANAPKAEVLPIADYFYFHRSTDIERSKVLHFMGPERFRDGCYARLGQRVIRELREAGPA